MKNINNFTHWKKNGSVDVTFRCAITHQKHLVWAQYTECSGHFQYTPRIY